MGVKMLSRNKLHGSGAQALAAAVLVLAALAGTALGDDWVRKADPSERMFDETFDLPSGAGIDVDMRDADVHLVQRSGKSAHVELYIEGRDRDRAEEYFERMKFSARVRNNTLFVTGDERRTNWSFWNIRRNVRVRLLVTFPEDVEMRIVTRDGDITADKLSGDLLARSSDGDIRITSIKGGEIDIKTSDGDVNFETIEGEEVTVRTSDGDLVAEKVSGQHVSFRSSDGDVEVTHATAKEISMSTSDGDIRAEVEGTTMRAKTSDGSIEVRCVGSMSLDLVTSDGDIELEIPEGIKADLNLRGQRIRVDGELNLQGEIGKRRIRGQLKGGGPEISARTSDGTISLALK